MLGLGVRQGVTVWLVEAVFLYAAGHQAIAVVLVS